MNQRSLYYLRLDDDTVLPVLVIIPKEDDAMKIHQNDSLCQRIIASACLQLQKHISTPLSCALEIPIHVTTDEYHIKISRIVLKSSKSQSILMPLPQERENVNDRKNDHISLTQSGFVEKFTDGWIPKFSLLRQMSWYWELIVTLLHFVKDPSHQPFTVLEDNAVKKKLRSKKRDTKLEDYINKHSAG